MLNSLLTRPGLDLEVCRQPGLDSHVLARLGASRSENLSGGDSQPQKTNHADLCGSRAPLSGPLIFLDWAGVFAQGVLC